MDTNPDNSTPEPQLQVQVRPGSTDGHLVVSASSTGISKLEAAAILRHVAQKWESDSR